MGRTPCRYPGAGPAAARSAGDLRSTRLSGRGRARTELSVPVDRLMHLEIVGLLESYLIDGSARVMVRSSEHNRMQGMRFGAFRPQQALDTPLYDQDAAVAAIRAKQSGFLRYYRNGRPVLFFYYPLSALGWYYALEVAEEDF